MATPRNRTVAPHCGSPSLHCAMTGLPGHQGELSSEAGNGADDLGTAFGRESAVVIWPLSSHWIPKRTRQANASIGRGARGLR